MSTPHVYGGRPPDGQQPNTPPPRPLSPPERLERVQAVLTTLRDALEQTADEYSPHLRSRAIVCDVIRDELAVIALELAGCQRSE
jgi:hypothetical protein